jgi:hypothetical protein
VVINSMALSHETKVAMGISGENSMRDIMNFLGSDPQHPLKDGEFGEFWRSLTDEEKDEFRQADLGKKM